MATASARLVVNKWNEEGSTMVQGSVLEDDGELCWKCGRWTLYAIPGLGVADAERGSAGTDAAEQPWECHNEDCDFQGPRKLMTPINAQEHAARFIVPQQFAEYRDGKYRVGTRSWPNTEGEKVSESGISFEEAFKAFATSHHQAYLPERVPRRG